MAKLVQYLIYVEYGIYKDTWRRNITNLAPVSQLIGALERGALERCSAKLENEIELFLGLRINLLQRKCDLTDEVYKSFIQRIVSFLFLYEPSEHIHITALKSIIVTFLLEIQTQTA